MEVRLFQNAELLQLLLQLRKVDMQKFLILAACRRSIPAEQHLLHAVDHPDDLRSCDRSPLRKEMGHLKITDPVFFAHHNPALQIRKIKHIAVCRLFHLYELHRRAFLADCSIQWRSKLWCQNHIDATVRCRRHKMLNNLPVLLREYRHMVVVCQTVHIEPLCPNQLLCLQYRSEDRHLCLDTRQYLSIRLLCIRKRNAHRIRPRRRIRRSLQIDPEAVPLVFLENDTVIFQRLKQIRIQSRLPAKIIVIIFLMCRIPARHIHDLPHLKIRKHR